MFAIVEQDVLAHESQLRGIQQQTSGKTGEVKQSNRYFKQHFDK